ncbi:bi-domain-containing oxidoreductase [Desulfonatronovibrio hydrogenovorans]|uniref:bi-domain-containing oxidoreductase n=1 Tax=Desulfonatronovibrio hydrogenovorans TaxID=53245 RepID=UPI0004909444|nr:bi-domain-containing oxidoreductase [Desulfonatronovibrio hydrogenovorans]
MKQILQDLTKGATYIVEAPDPAPKTGSLLIATKVSLVSAGTERMLVDFGKAGYLQKAKQQPEKVKMVLDKARTDGIMATYDAVRSKLEQPIPLGYCNVGVVSEVRGQRSVVSGLEDKKLRRSEGQNSREYDLASDSTSQPLNCSPSHLPTFSTSPFKPGDRVVSNGPHAEIVRIPKNLCARIPDNVSDEEASFTVLGAIALQGIRLAGPTLGECFAVTGVGLIGLLTVQLLKAQGCRVLAIDFDDKKLDLARQFGAETCNPGQGGDPVSAGMAFSRGKGMDGVIICAATKSNDPVVQAARMSRKRGRIVLVGVTGLELNRADFYEKELTFQVSCSYGPGRYDPEYEDKGHDYPLGFVRWTEQRNFEAVLDMMAEEKIDVTPLISHRFAFEDAPKAYEVLSSESDVLGILLEYKTEKSFVRPSETPLRGPWFHGVNKGQRTVKLKDEEGEKPEAGGAVVSFIGAGNYASRVLIPAFKKAGARLRTIVTSGGTSAAVTGKKAGFEYASTDVEAMLADENTNAVVIATRHNSHARFVLQALRAGKNVFVEKPLCLTLEELDAIEEEVGKIRSLEDEKESKEATSQLPSFSASPRLMVGFNRRFSPQIQKMKGLLDTVKEPKSFIMTMNAGAIPADHWTQDPGVGGGRIIGEACHYIDLMRFLAGSEIVSVQGRCMGDVPGVDVPGDKSAITLGFADGSFGTIHYLANGHASFPKERIEVFAAGCVLQLDNFRKLKGFGWPGFKKMNLWRQDKGQKACAEAFVEAVKQGGPAPIPVEEIFEVARVSIEVAGG